jgi:hypothetical protein
MDINNYTDNQYTRLVKYSYAKVSMKTDSGVGHHVLSTIPKTCIYKNK